MLGSTAVSGLDGRSWLSRELLLPASHLFLDPLGKRSRKGSQQGTPKTGYSCSLPCFGAWTISPKEKVLFCCSQK